VLKDNHKIILLSVLSGILTWILDALIDSLVFYKGSFWSMLWLNDAHELYMRSIFMVAVTFTGVVIARFVARRERIEHEKIVAEKALYESEDRLRSVMESTEDSIYLVDTEYRYLFMNRKHLERLSVLEKDYIGRAYGDFHSGEETQELIRSVNRVLTTGESIRREHLSRRDNRYFLRTYSPVKDADARIVAVTIVSKDVHDLKQMEEKLRNLSLTDELTGLYNRRGFFTMVEPLLKLAKRNKTLLYMLYADLDNLKGINDALGHHEGDQVIVDTANILKATFRGTDIIARIGGDEFVIIPIASKKDDAEKGTIRFKDRIHKHNKKANRSYTLSISMGMSCFDPGSPLTIDDLLKQAEKLMYEEKLLKQTTD